jgi:hypothetical protein
MSDGPDDPDVDAAVEIATDPDAQVEEPDALGDAGEQGGEEATGGIRERVGGKVDLTATEPHPDLEDVDLADALRPDTLAETWRPRAARGLQKAGALDGRAAWIDLTLAAAGAMYAALDEQDAGDGEQDDGERDRDRDGGGTYEADDGTEVRTA